MQNREALNATLLFGVITSLIVGGAFVIGALSKSSSPALPLCSGAIEEKAQCWDDALTSSLATQGFQKTLELFLSLYAKEPLFAEDCHNYMHKLGGSAYDVFSSGEQIEPIPETSYCSYGFYHGFMQQLISKGASIDEATRFCGSLRKSADKRVQSTEDACYHGIGHGWATIHEEKSSAWGNERAITIPALALCEKIAKTETHLWRCASGIFDSIAIAYYSSQFGLVMQDSNPLWLCKEQNTPLIKGACYSDLLTAVAWKADYGFSKSLLLAEKWVEPEYFPSAVKTLANINVRYLLKKPDGLLQGAMLCRRFEASTHKLCIEGLVAGVHEYGAPGKEYEGLVSFCKSDALQGEEKKWCGTMAGDIITSLFSRPITRESCRLLGPLAASSSCANLREE